MSKKAKAAELDRIKGVARPPAAPRKGRPHPVRPRAAIRIGVTGHRKSRLDAAALDRLRAQTGEVLRLVRQEVAAIVEGHAWAFADAPPEFRFISPLADGADMIGAEAALKEGFLLLAPLPFARERYHDDFAEEDRDTFDSLLARASAVIELDAHRGSEDETSTAYLHAGLLTVAQSDLIIAIWDGDDARGVGGTAMIKDAAIEAGKPVVWINAARDEPVRLIERDAPAGDFAADLLRAIRRVLAPPAADDIGHEIGGTHTGARRAYREFLAETDSTANFGFFYQFLERLLAGQSVLKIRLHEAPLAARLKEEHAAPLLAAAPMSERTRKVFDDLIARRFIFADLLATHYASLYRSSYYFNYLFSAIAVLLALMSLIITDIDKALWIGSEVAVILAVLFVTFRGRTGRWHEKWIDYRHLAEELRHFRRVFLSVGGGYDPGEDDREVTGGWVDWYLRATVREAGLADIRFAPERIKTVARAIVDCELKPQIGYHKNKAATLHRIEHRLHRLGTYAFGATLVVCVAYLLAEGAVSVDLGGAAHAAKTAPGAKGAHGGDGFAAWLNTRGKYWVTLLTGFLPALGAAIFGIRVQGEYGSTAERSTSTAEDLELICEQFERIAAAPAPKMATLQECVDNAGRVILAENKDWRILYISKPLNLPG